MYVMQIARFLGLLLIQIAYGGFTAGLKAGYVSDTWPLMLGKLIPPGLFSSFINILENPFTIVFIHRWFAFVASGIFTGLAGILWVPLNGLTTPDVLYWPQSGKFVFFAVLGGFRNFTGPIVGAVIFNYLEVYAVALTQYWQMLLGVVLIVLVTFLPAGIVGTAARLARK